jgi:hypothetical protein
MAPQSKSPAERLEESFKMIDDVPGFPGSAKAALKTLITVEYLTGYADGYAKGKRQAGAERALGAFAGA